MHNAQLYSNFTETPQCTENGGICVKVSRGNMSHRHSPCRITQRVGPASRLSRFNSKQMWGDRELRDFPDSRLSPIPNQFSIEFLFQEINGTWFSALGEIGDGKVTLWVNFSFANNWRYTYQNSNNFISVNPHLTIHFHSFISFIDCRVKSRQSKASTTCLISRWVKAGWMLTTWLRGL